MNKAVKCQFYKDSYRLQRQYQIRLRKSVPNFQDILIAALQSIINNIL